MRSNEKQAIDRIEIGLKELYKNIDYTNYDSVKVGNDKCDMIAEIILDEELEGVGRDFVIRVLNIVDSFNRWNFFKFLVSWTLPSSSAYAAGLLSSYCTDYTDDIDEVKEMFAFAGKESLLKCEFRNSSKSRRFYDSLPNEVTIYRGTCVEESENKRYGVSWTTDIETAEFFAYRFKKEGRCVLRAKVRKEDIIAVLTCRNESEVIVLEPKNVEIDS